MRKLYGRMIFLAIWMGLVAAAAFQAQAATDFTARSAYPLLAQLQH